jgi:hypothetical protein
LIEIDDHSAGRSRIHPAAVHLFISFSAWARAVGANGLARCPLRAGRPSGVKYLRARLAVQIIELSYENYPRSVVSALVFPELQ